MRVSKSLSPALATLLLMLTVGCGTIARESLKSESGQKNFMESCVSEASKSGNVSVDKIKAYCQCSLDGLKSDRVSDDELSEFFASQSNTEKWPKVISEILTECAQKSLT